MNTPNIITATLNTGSVARDYRRYVAGKVIAINYQTHTLRLDVGAQLPDGTRGILEDVPFVPQSPPSIGDNVAIGYATTGMHGARVGAIRLSGSNPQSSLTISSGDPFITIGTPSRGLAGAKALGTLIGSGLLSARPAPAASGPLYSATDTGQTFRDNGSTWDAIATNSQAYADASVPGGNTLTGAVTPQNFASAYTVPANTLYVGQRLKIKCYGVWSCTVVPDFYNLRIVFGGASFAATTTANTAVSSITNQQWILEADIVINTIGFSGGCEVQGMVTQFTTPNVSTARAMANTTNIVVDTTIDQVIKISVICGLAGSITITERIMVVS